MRRPALAFALISALLLAVVAGGCGSRKTTLGPDLPPEVSVFIQGRIDPVSHRVHLYWFGSDPDGNVVAYLMRFVPSNGTADPKWDTLYCKPPASCTDSVFTVFTGDSALIHTQFEVRAMDDKGLLSAPAVQRFTLTNLAPAIHITNKLRWNPSLLAGISDSSFASVTVSWTIDDLDGGGPGLHTRVWLDHNQAQYDSTAAYTFTVPSARFLQGGAYRQGPRTLYLQAVDDGGRSGPLDSTTWFVRAPAKRDPVYHRSLLVVDDSRSSNSNDLTQDTLYVQTLRRNNFPDSSYSILRFDYSNPFRSAADLQQTLRLFDAVAWYRGYDFHDPGDFFASRTLENYQDVVGQFIMDGGRILLEGLFLIGGRNSFGALREDFVTRYLNCQQLALQFNTNFPDSTVGLSTKQNGLRLRSALYVDAPIQMSAPPSFELMPGLRGFIANDTSQVAFWFIQAGAAQIANLDSTFYRNHLDVPLAMSVSAFPGGRVIVLPFPAPVLGVPTATPFDRRPLARIFFGKNGLNGLLSP